MTVKDWRRFNGKRFGKQATFKHKIGATHEAFRRRKMGQKIRIIKDGSNYVVYVRSR